MVKLKVLGAWCAHRRLNVDDGYNYRKSGARDQTRPTIRSCVEDAGASGAVNGANLLSVSLGVLLFLLAASWAI